MTLACGRVRQPCCVLVIYDCKVGASELVDYMPLFVARSKAKSSQKLEIGMTRFVKRVSVVQLLTLL